MGFRISNISGWRQRFRSFVIGAILAIAAAPALAHEHDECLGHHWELPQYCAEIRYQLMLMVAALALVAILFLISHIRRTRRCGS